VDYKRWRRNLCPIYCLHSFRLYPQLAGSRTEI